MRENKVPHVDLGKKKVARKSYPRQLLMSQLKSAFASYLKVANLFGMALHCTAWHTTGKADLWKADYWNRKWLQLTAGWRTLAGVQQLSHEIAMALRTRICMHKFTVIWEGTCYPPRQLKADYKWSKITRINNKSIFLKVTQTKQHSTTQQILPGK